MNIITTISVGHVTRVRLTQPRRYEAAEFEAADLVITTEHGEQRIGLYSDALGTLCAFDTFDIDEE